MTMFSTQSLSVLLLLTCGMVAVPRYSTVAARGKPATKSKGPIPTKSMFVLQEDIECRGGLGPGRTIVLEYGQSVEVLVEQDANTPEGFLRVSRPEGMTCRVPDIVLGPFSPDGKATLARTYAALAEGRLVEGTQLAEQLKHGEEVEPLEILAAIYDATGDEEHSREVYERIKELGKRTELAPLPSLTSPATRPPPVGEKRFVLATRLRLRERPSAKAPVLKELFINTPVMVEGVEGEFARVSVAGSNAAVMEIDFTIAATPLRTEENPHVNGYAAWAFLGDKPLVVDEQLHQADEHEVAGRFLEAMVFLERAMLLDDRDKPQFRRLARLAVSEHRWQVAAWAASMMQARTTKGRVEWQLVYGCKGQLSQAVLVDDETVDVRNPSLLPRNACVVNVDVKGVCKPPFAPDCELVERVVKTPAEQKRLEQDQKAEERLLAKITRDWEKERDVFHARLRRLREILTPWPYARVRITGTTGQDNPRKLLFAYALNYQRERGCDRLDLRPLSVIGVASDGIPWPAPGKEAELWIGLPTYSDVLVGLVEDETAAGAKKQVEDLVATLWEAGRKNAWEFERVLDEKCLTYITGPGTDCDPGCGCH